MATFSSAGDHILVLATRGDKVAYTLDDTGGTFSGTIELLRAINPTSGWVVIKTITSGDEDGSWVNNTGRDQHVKLQVKESTGDSTTATLVIAEDNEGSISFRGNQIVNASGRVLMDFNGPVVDLPGVVNSAVTIAPSGSTYRDTRELTEAINAAYSGGKQVNLSSGNFSVDAEVALVHSKTQTPGFTLRGAGALQTKIYNEIQGGGYILKMTPSTAYRFNNFTYISDIGFYGPQVIEDGNHGGILFTGLNDFQIKRCYFEKLGGYAIKSGVIQESGFTDPSQSVRFTIEQLYVYFCGLLYGGYGIHLGEGATTGGRVSGVAMNHCGGGIYTKCFGGTYDNCPISYCRYNPALKFPYATSGSTRAPFVTVCYFEGNHAGDIDLYSVNNAYCFGNNHNTNLPDNGISSFTQDGNTTTLVAVNNAVGLPPFGDDFYVTGRTITIKNCSETGNNGTFTVTKVDGNTVTYTNANGVTIAGNGGATYTLPVMEHFCYKAGRPDSTDTVTSLTFDSATNLVTLVSPSSHFDHRDFQCDIHISNASNAANDGIYNIQEIVSATTVKYRNPNGVTEGAVAQYNMGPPGLGLGRVGNGSLLINNIHNSNGDIADVTFYKLTSQAKGTQIINPQYQTTTNATFVEDDGEATEYKTLDGWLYGNIKKEKLNIDQNGSYTCDMSLASKFRVDVNHINGLASITQSASVNTIVSDAEIFTEDNIDGKDVWIESAANAANNGRFTATYVSATTITVPNASGVTEDPTDATLMFAELEFKIPSNQPLTKHQGRELEIEMINPSSTIDLELAWETGTGGFFANNRNINLLPAGERAWFLFKYDSESEAWLKAYPFDANPTIAVPEYGGLLKRVSGNSMSLTTSFQVLAGTWDGQGSSSNITVTNPAKVTYTGSATKKFLVTGYVTFSDPATTGRYPILNLLKNGAEEDSDKMIMHITAATNELITQPFSWVVSLAKDDYVELGARVLASTLTVKCYAGSMMVKEILE